MKSARRIVAAAVIFAVLVAAGAVFARRVFPKGFSGFVEQRCSELGLDPLLVYAQIMAESGFNEGSISHAGAYGLMQITPDTFDWIQSKTREREGYTATDLLTPEVNIKYGTLILKFLLDEFGSRDTALAAYNAGYTAVKNWLGDPRYSDDGVTLKHIPYEETRTYVKRIARYYKIYKFLY